MCVQSLEFVERRIVWTYF